jgi:hypothetical protein
MPAVGHFSTGEGNSLKTGDLPVTSFNDARRARKQLAIPKPLTLGGPQA